MKSIKETILAFALGALGMTSIAISAEDIEKHVMIKIDHSGDEDAVVDLEVDGVAEVFEMPELEVGEQRIVTTKSGKEVTISKTNDGISISLDGEDIELPKVHGNLGARIHRSSGLHEKLENRIHISGADLDDNQKQIIKDAFLAAGIDKEVSFNDHQVMVFSTENSFDFSDNPGFEWKNEDGKDIQFVIKTDDDTDIKIKKKHVIIKETKD